MCCNDLIYYHPQCGHHEYHYGQFCTHLRRQLHRINDARELQSPGIPFSLDQCRSPRFEYAKGMCGQCREDAFRISMAQRGWNYGGPVLHRRHGFF
ncbi:hypothetical protein K504DRAFT_468533 [Pleomassaria siparia CBS 279.74]|uniref:Uncharacterized protein n=1 Tax=Pleomassaria siparia CBS 279.74 TaxID=1314801 RepID=A0A6G1K6U8_9PLEO|nr:hypothetical protein K504DRAFT_468533 [Pleomassaria siparia CBS 279.74]